MIDSRDDVGDSTMDILALLDEPRQAELERFGRFAVGADHDLSDMTNAWDVWSSLPRFFPASIERRLRTADGRHADNALLNFERGGRAYRVVVSPAQLSDADGNQAAYFPGAREELLDEVLVRMLASEVYGHHVPRHGLCGVCTTYALLGSELARLKKSSNHGQIRRSLEIMRGTRIVVTCEGEPLYDGNLINEIRTLDPHARRGQPRRLFITMPQLVERELSNGAYRQLDYRRLFRIRHALGRWLYRRLVVRYTQAAKGNTYHIRYKTFAESALLPWQEAKKNRAHVRECLAELIELGVLEAFDAEEVLLERAVVDVVYVLKSSAAFGTEQKRSNARRRDGSALTLRPYPHQIGHAPRLAARGRLPVDPAVITPTDPAPASVAGGMPDPHARASKGAPSDGDVDDFELRPLLQQARRAAGRPRGR